MKLILIGAFIETIELARRLNFLIAGYTANQMSPIERYNELFFFGNDEKLIANKRKFCAENLLFITPDIPKVRERLFAEYSKAGFQFTNLISDKANIAVTASLKESSSIMVQDFVNVSSGVEVGRGVKVNTAANIMHDCKIGDFVTIAPNAVLLGGVVVETAAYIGANSTILPGVRIGKNAIVGAGAVVTKDVQENETVVGVPATVLKK